MKIIYVVLLLIITSVTVFAQVEIAQEFEGFSDSKLETPPFRINIQNSIFKAMFHYTYTIDEIMNPDNFMPDLQNNVSDFYFLSLPFAGIGNLKLQGFASLAGLKTSALPGFSEFPDFTGYTESESDALSTVVLNAGKGGYKINRDYLFNPVLYLSQTNNGCRAGASAGLSIVDALYFEIIQEKVFYNSEEGISSIYDTLKFDDYKVLPADFSRTGFYIRYSAKDIKPALLNVYSGFFISVPDYEPTGFNSFSGFELKYKKNVISFRADYVSDYYLYTESTTGSRELLIKGAAAVFPVDGIHLELAGVFSLMRQSVYPEYFRNTSSALQFKAVFEKNKIKSLSDVRAEAIIYYGGEMESDGDYIDKLSCRLNGIINTDILGGFKLGIKNEIRFYSEPVTFNWVCEAIIDNETIELGVNMKNSIAPKKSTTSWNLKWKFNFTMSVLEFQLSIDEKRNWNLSAGLRIPA